jgi:Tfp pilus assembly protein PilW
MTLNKHDGFTMIETFIAMFMLSITMVAFYSVYRMQTRSLKGQENRLEAQQTARTALDFMVREIRNARYNPAGEDNGNSCADGAAGRPGIILADDDTLHFSYDANGDGDCADVSENIKYAFAGSDITRTADGSAEVVTDGNATGLILAYFDQDDNALTTLPLDAAGRDSIKRVSITVTIDSKNMADKFGGSMTAEMKTNVDLRNPA